MAKKPKIVYVGKTCDMSGKPVTNQEAADYFNKLSKSKKDKTA